MKERKILSLSGVTLLKIMVKTPSLKICQNKTTLLTRVFFLFSIKKKGSMALEGSLVLPLFLFFIVTVLFTLEVVRFESNMMEALHQTGNNQAAQAYLVKYANQPKENLNTQILAYLDKQLYPYLCVEGNKQGVLIQDLSTIDTNGEILIRAEYKITPLIGKLPIGTIVMRDKFVGHAFVGYTGHENQKAGSNQEIYVYITRTGTRYHKSINCTHLRIKIQEINASEINKSRSQSGEKYYACERCHPQKAGQVFITTDGNRYHSQADCSSLKREVHMILLREAGAYQPCQRCS